MTWQGSDRHKDYLMWETKSRRLLLCVPLQLYNGLLYVLGTCHLETVSALEVSIVANTAYCLSSILSSFHYEVLCLTRGNNDHKKMYTFSQPLANKDGS